ncbi:Crp/Fnr family transcriptional regulator [Roseofilum capinflatum]|uniref:Cyclic nucleotide-binding domain-containing protein n=1 Tax=Roseofilum capinflatum BLCC-M114 TaxID=3022440 RepID=A0ABT7B324_9CYAN|nr:cyclic nucleotide-binding domain-containing protein [Roseofilum capinflatum]MDJ1173577.1 cyclic nucleotide-binding domain-containing protein [Roseofilum capinflatum BLCC-M114]
MNPIILLQNLSLFQSLSLDELILISQELVQEQYLEHEIILAAGKVMNACYIVGSGTVISSKRSGDQLIPIKEIASGSGFGYLDLFDDSPSQLQFTAKTDCQLFKIDKKRLMSLGYQRPQILISICRDFSQTLQQVVYQQWMQEVQSCIN